MFTTILKRREKEEKEEEKLVSRDERHVFWSEEERAKEAERAEVLTKVHDPKERQRLHKLFNIEREHAKEIIVRLSAQLS